MSRKRKSQVNAHPPAESPYQRVLRLAQKEPTPHDPRFDSPFVWGNAITAEVYTDTSADLLNVVVRNTFFKTYRVWLKELGRAHLSRFKLAEIIAEAQIAQRQGLNITQHLSNCYQVPPATVRRWLLFLGSDLLDELGIPPNIEVGDEE